MNGTTHMIVGGMTGGLVLAYCIASGVPTFDFYGYEIHPLVVTIASIAGGLAPDIDMPNSKAGHFLRNALRLTLVFSAIFLAVMYFIPHTGINLLDSAVGMSTKVNRNIPLLLMVFCILILILIEKSKHRGFTHTSVSLLIISAPLLYFFYSNTIFTGANVAVSAHIGFVLGWFSHMVIDTFNYPGTPWLWPVTKKHFKIMRVDSGTGEERFFLIISVIVFALSYAYIFTKN